MTPTEEQWVWARETIRLIYAKQGERSWMNVRDGCIPYEIPPEKRFSHALDLLGDVLLDRLDILLDLAEERVAQQNREIVRSERERAANIVTKHFGTFGDEPARMGRIIAAILGDQP